MNELLRHAIRARFLHAKHAGARNRKKANTPSLDATTCRRSKVGSSNWLNTLKKVEHASLTILFFHYAGGNSGVYRSLSKLISTDVHIVAVEMPGRAKRFTEPPIDNMEVVAECIASALHDARATLPSNDLVFFGHSVGAKIALAVAQTISQKNALKLRKLIASGSRAPHLPRKGPTLHDLPQAEFINELRNYGGTPAAILEDSDLLELLTPMLRSDFKLAENHQRHTSQPIACDIHVFGGAQDAMVETDLLDAWSMHTVGRCDVKLFSGGHFFLHDDERNVAIAIDHILASVRHELQAGKV
ncbi:thioesterase II family protein [Dyella choica]|uniref:thioesterase II family protein n=1 Tax=Dyella choica TaxID=1927959 RepID=UPI0013150B60|nr:alpha/beta fold hydrolase [Dyella choica]